MQKLPVALRLDEGTYERVAQLAKRDRRSISNVLLMAIEKGLPAIEAHIQTYGSPVDACPARGTTFACPAPNGKLVGLRS